MKHMTKKVIPEHVEEVVDKITCDLCGRKINTQQENLRDNKIDEVVISYDKGTTYPDGGSGVHTKLDMCGTCFEERLMPWIEAQNGKMEHIEYCF